MMLTDKVWKLLEPATSIGENLTKENIEKGIDDGTYQIFMDEQSVVITADYKDDVENTGRLLASSTSGGSTTVSAYRINCLAK